MKSSLIKQISLITITAFLLVLGIGGAAWWKFKLVVANQDQVSATTAALRHQLEADMMHDALRADVLAALQAAGQKNATELSAAATDLGEHAKDFRSHVAENSNATLSPAVNEAIKNVSAPLASYVAAAESIVSLAGKDAAAAQAQYAAFTAAFTVLEKQMSEVSDVIEACAKQKDDENKTLVASFNSLLWIALACSAAVLAFLTLLLARIVPRPFRKIVDQLTSASEAASATTAKVATTSQLLASGASESAASLEETSASLEEIASMIKRTASNAQTAKQLGNETRNSAESGATDMKSMSVAMDEINAASTNIAKIMKTIDEIAFQTNLLALNAAVEAARAGEAGAGFAVVADEVRALAQRSAVAAKETAALIEDSIAKSKRGLEFSSKVSSGLDDIVIKARQIDELVAKIAAASSEQSQGITQINSAVSQMDHATQDAAASSAQIASTSEELNEQTHTLNEGITALCELVGGGNKSSAPLVTSQPASHPAKPFVKKAKAFKPTRPAVTTSASDSIPFPENADNALAAGKFADF